ncbi:MAG: flagellar assembly protein [Bdellovibrio sp.]|nr:MAG: flagellar assembly protein [Bdellovibrio sp.]
MSKRIPRHQSDFRVLKFEPPRFDLGIPEAAMKTTGHKKATSQKQSSFQLSEIVLQQTGLKQLEARSAEDDIERRALEFLKDIQEEAFREAYNLGLDEGRKEAFRNTSTQIEERLAAFDKLLGNIETVKNELFAQAENHIVQLTYHLAHRLAAHEISINPEATKSILREAIEVAQAEENVTVKVAPEQFEFIDELKREGSREWEFMKKIRLEPDPQVGLGGCIVTTNYGEIDSRFEQRMGRLWETLQPTLSRPRDQFR